MARIYLEDIFQCFPVFRGRFYNKPDTIVKMEILCEQTRKKIRTLKIWRLNKHDSKAGKPNSKLNLVK